jgi:hypothetical protein
VRVGEVSFDRAGHPRTQPGRGIVFGLAGLALLGIGIAIGTRIASPQRTPVVEATTVTLPAVARTVAQPPAAASPAPTRAGAVAAAAEAITAFNGDVLLDPSRLEHVVARIASTESRAQLTAAFEQASAETRTKLGAGTVPAPVIVLRTVPVGYRVERFTTAQATVAVWYVGIVGSGATVQPQQSWRTEVVSLVWESGAWKVSSFRSSDGPTPPLSTAEVPATPGQLFTTIPLYDEFSRNEP